MSSQGSLFGRSGLVRVAIVIAVAAISFTGGCVMAAQPRMTNALNFLQSAKGELQASRTRQGWSSGQRHSPDQRGNWRSAGGHRRGIVMRRCRFERSDSIQGPGPTSHS